MRIHTVARFHAGDVGSDGLDDAGDIGSRRVGQVRLARVRARADVGLYRVDADGFHARRAPDPVLARGSATSSSFITSGGPNSWTTMAFMESSLGERSKVKGQRCKGKRGDRRQK